MVLAVERLGAGSDLSMAIADSPDPVNAAATLTYTLTVSNHGPDPAESLTVVDALPRALAVLAIATAPHSSATTRVIESFYMSLSFFCLAGRRPALVDATLHPTSD